MGDLGSPSEDQFNAFFAVEADGPFKVKVINKSTQELGKILTWAWYWGDGTSERIGTIDPYEPGDVQFDQEFTHTYDSPGAKEIQLTIFGVLGPLHNLPGRTDTFRQSILIQDDGSADIPEDPPGTGGEGDWTGFPIFGATSCFVNGKGNLPEFESNQYVSVLLARDPTQHIEGGNFRVFFENSNENKRTNN